jgi:hypothetical protein
MNFIKKAIDGNVDDFTHIQFQKFSKGIFKDRAVLKVKKTKDKYTINSSPEFANEFVLMAAKKLGSNSAKIEGAIVSTSDLKDRIDYDEIKQFQGVKRYLISKEMTGNQLVSLLEEFPKTFFGLTFNINENNKLKIKPKAPKSGKPGKGDQEPKADFCKFITNDAEIGKTFVFEKDDFKKAEIKHNFLVEKIILPQTDEKDFAKIREMAKRQGKITRIANIDDIKSEKEYEFTA